MANTASQQCHVLIQTCEIYLVSHDATLLMPILPLINALMLFQKPLMLISWDAFRTRWSAHI